MGLSLFLGGVALGQIPDDLCTNCDARKQPLTEAQYSDTQLNQVMSLKTLPEEVLSQPIDVYKINADLYNEFVSILDSAEKRILVELTDPRSKVTSKYGFINLSLTRFEPGTPAEVYNELVEAIRDPEKSAYQTEDVQEYFTYLREAGKTLPDDLKHLLLIRIGEKLSSGYDHEYSDTKAVFRKTISYQEIFSNALVDGAQGGICGNIHEFLMQAQKELGYESYALSTIWNGGASSNGGGHIISAFRDPKTGLFYIQNYDDIIALQAEIKNIRQVQDAAAQSLGVSTAVSIVQDSEGRFHTGVTTNGLQMIDGYRRGEGIRLKPGERIRVRGDFQNFYRGAAAKVGLGANDDPSWSHYVFLGGNNTQAHPTLPDFKQGYLGYGFQFEEHSGPVLGMKNTDFTYYGKAAVGVQSFERVQYGWDDKSNYRQSQQAAFYDAKVKLNFSAENWNQKSRVDIGTDFNNGMYDLSLNEKKRAAWNGNASHPVSWMRNYISYMRKVSQRSSVGVQISDVRQLIEQNLTTFWPPRLKHEFMTGEIQFVHFDNRWSFRINGKAYLLPEGGTAGLSSAEIIRKIFEGRRFEVTAFGYGTIASTLKESGDPWYQLEPFQTGKVGLSVKRAFPKSGTVLNAHAGVQYQTNTPLNEFDVTRAFNSGQYIDNPGIKGQPMTPFAAVTVKFGALKNKKSR